MPSRKWGRSRALKRAVARQVFRALTGHCTVPDYSDLRPARQAKNLTLSAAATHLGVWPTDISQLELGKRRNDDLANAYRAWPLAA
jgi:transposase